MSELIQVCILSTFWSRPYSTEIFMFLFLGEKPFECKVCGQRFTKSGLLIAVPIFYDRKDLFSVTKQRKIRFSKLKIHFLPNFLGNLNSHMRLHAWRCEICHLTFPDQNQLRNHEMQFHPNPLGPGHI